MVPGKPLHGRRPWILLSMCFMHVRCGALLYTGNVAHNCGARLGYILEDPKSPHIFVNA